MHWVLMAVSLLSVFSASSWISHQSLKVLRHAESYSSLYYRLSLFVRSLLELMAFFAGFLKHIKILVETIRQPGFQEYTPLSQTIKNAINFRFFCGKKLEKV